MASKNKTARLKLNLWDGTDRPQRGDFNSDNMIVEDVLGGHIEDMGIHLKSKEKSRVEYPVKTLIYEGDGEAQKSITLDEVPVGVIVFCDSQPAQYYDVQAGCTIIYSATAFYGAGATYGIELNGKVLTVRQDSVSANSLRSCLNEAGKTYELIVIK